MFSIPEIQHIESLSLEQSLFKICEMIPDGIVFSTSLGQEDQIITDVIFKNKLPMDRLSLQSYLAGSLSFIGSQIFTYMATVYLSSGMIALMFGLAPIMTGLIGRFFFHVHLK